MACSSKVSTCVGTLLLGAIIWACGSAGAAAQTQPAPLLMPPKRAPGDVFTYNWAGDVETWTYAGKSNGLDCFAVKTALAQGTECHDGDDNLVSRDGWRPPGLGINIHLSFPLYVGKEWEYTYVTRPANEGGFVGHRLNGNHTQKLKVTALEQVATAAGTFDCYKIEGIDQNWGSVDVDNLLLYYSPRLGYVKRRIWYYAGQSGESKLELVNYRLAH